MMLKILAAIGISVLFYCCSETDYAQGRNLYNSKCANCHMEDGTGLKGLIPPLANADFMLQNPKAIPCIIHKGMNAPVLVNGEIYNQQVMPAITSLNEVEITNITNYILTAWGNKGQPLKLDETKLLLKSCE